MFECSGNPTFSLSRNSSALSFQLTQSIAHPLSSPTSKSPQSRLLVLSTTSIQAKLQPNNSYNFIRFLRKLSSLFHHVVHTFFEILIRRLLQLCRLRHFILLVAILLCFPSMFKSFITSLSSLPNTVAFTTTLPRFATVLHPLATVIKSSGAPTQPPQKNMVTLAAILFVISAALASAETAITTLWPWKVRELAEKEGPRSPFSTLEGDLTRFLTTILVSTTTATVFSTAIATDLAGDAFGPRAVPYVTAALTVVFLFLGEILPKALAVHAPAKVARLMVPVINFLSVIVYPVGKLLAWLSTQILRALKLPMETNTTVSEEELRLIVAGADQSGSIEKYESQIIHNVLDLEDTDVSGVMCPRVDMVAIPASESLEKLVQLESESHYSRMPVYDGTVDNIVGVAMTKSLLRFLSSNGDATELLRDTRVADIMDPAFFVPESMSVWVALEKMRKRRLHMAIVVDEYGGTAGLVTLEDILEEVVGEIYDEDDDYEAESALMQKDEQGRIMVEGQAELEKVGDALNMSLTEDDLHDYGTISGFLCARMGGIPKVDDSLIFNNIKFTVIDADDRRVKSVRAEILSEEEYNRIVLEEGDNSEDVGDSENGAAVVVVVNEETGDEVVSREPLE